MLDVPIEPDGASGTRRSRGERAACGAAALLQRVRDFAQVRAEGEKSDGKRPFLP
ncbi:MAG: hypothetical protein H6668_10340 [Ardenticatenaceae bacterium]|nr:hypothetical protein [Ardenticatenaceae bacterium]